MQAKSTQPIRALQLFTRCSSQFFIKSIFPRLQLSTWPPRISWQSPPSQVRFCIATFLPPAWTHLYSWLCRANFFQAFQVKHFYLLPNLMNNCLERELLHLTKTNQAEDIIFSCPSYILQVNYQRHFWWNASSTTADNDWGHLAMIRLSDDH